MTDFGERVVALVNEQDDMDAMWEHPGVMAVVLEGQRLVYTGLEGWHYGSVTDVTGYEVTPDVIDAAILEEGLGYDTSARIVAAVWITAIRAWREQRRVICVKPGCTETATMKITNVASVYYDRPSVYCQQHGTDVMLRTAYPENYLVEQEVR